MHRFFVKPSLLIRKIFSGYVWNFSRAEPVVYLTFDDGPHPQITHWVLDLLKQYNAKATFFCVGENAERHPDVMARIASEGHATGNHSHTHPNGWHTPTKMYVDDVAKAMSSIPSPLFRPPYGRIKKAQADGVKALLGAGSRIIMWDVLSCDFDPSVTPEKCCNNVLKNMENGSIIVFHDSEKAAPNLRYALPRVMEAIEKKGWRCDAVSINAIK